MTHDGTGIPAELRISFDTAPSVETRAALSHEIDAYNARTVPQDARRFALLLHDESSWMVAGLSGVLAWQWLFVEALWVSDAWRTGASVERCWRRRKRRRWLRNVTRLGWILFRLGDSTWRSVIGSSAPSMTIRPARPATSYGSGWSLRWRCRRPRSPTDGTVRVVPHAG